MKKWKRGYEETRAKTFLSNKELSDAHSSRRLEAREATRAERGMEEEKAGDKGEDGERGGSTQKKRRQENAEKANQKKKNETDFCGRWQPRFLHSAL